MLCLLVACQKFLKSIKNHMSLQCFMFMNMDIMLMFWKNLMIIVDFVFLLREERPTKLLLAVLTENELLLLDTSVKKNIANNIIKLRYHRHNLLNAGYPYITPPVTCLHYCGECSETFMAEATLILPSLIVEKSIVTPELVVTGHSDGSICLWLCYCTDGFLSYKPLTLVVNTEDYFEK